MQERDIPKELRDECELAVKVMIQTTENMKFLEELLDVKI